MQLRMLVACCWRQVSTLQAGETSSVTTLRAQGTTTWTMGNQGPGKGGRLSPRVFGGTVCELEFACFVPVPERPIGEFAFHQLPCRPSLPVRFSAVPFASSAPPLAPSSLHCAHLPVWPAHSTLVATTAQRALWWGFWDEGVSRWRVLPHGFVVRQGAECR